MDSPLNINEERFVYFCGERPNKMLINTSIFKPLRVCFDCRGNQLRECKAVREWVKSTTIVSVIITTLDDNTESNV